MQSLHNQESLTRWSICSLGQAGSGSVTHNGIRSHNVQDLTGGLLPVVAEMIVIVVGVSQVTFEFRNARRVIVLIPHDPVGTCWQEGGRDGARSIRSRYATCFERCTKLLVAHTLYNSLDAIHFNSYDLYTCTCFKVWCAIALVNESREGLP